MVEGTFHIMRTCGPSEKTEVSFPSLVELAGRDGNNGHCSKEAVMCTKARECMGFWETEKGSG
jgi:hypothetical protein